MFELLLVGFLLIISVFLAFINWRIYQVTLEMLNVTVDIYHKTVHLMDYTKKTYEVLGGEEGLTPPVPQSKIIPMEDVMNIYDKYL
jgi:hypothetical protein